MTNEDINGAIAYLKSYRKLDEKLYAISLKNSISYLATCKCLQYWDMAIMALEHMVAVDTVKGGEAIDQNGTGNRSPQQAHW